MNHHARLTLLKSDDIVSTPHSEGGSAIIRALMLAAIVAILALAIVAQARLASEDSLASFVNCCTRV